MKKDDSHISAEQFVKIWQTSKSLKEAKKKAGVHTYFATRAYYFRKKGVPLKRFAGRGNRLDIPSLIALAKKYAPKE